MLDPKLERVLAAVLRLVLVGVIISTVSDAITDGFRFIERFPGISGTDFVLGEAGLFFMISATDWPAMLRASPFVRGQLQCWAVWLFLLGGLFATKSSAFAKPAGFGFVVAICLLAAFSLVALFRPRDIIKSWGYLSGRAGDTFPAVPSRAFEVPASVFVAFEVKE